MLVPRNDNAEKKKAPGGNLTNVRGESDKNVAIDETSHTHPESVTKRCLLLALLLQYDRV